MKLIAIHQVVYKGDKGLAKALQNDPFEVDDAAGEALVAAGAARKDETAPAEAPKPARKTARKAKPEPKAEAEAPADETADAEADAE